MITKLRLLNVKGITKTVDLSPITIVRGPNASGKSAIISAIAIGLVGYDPALGKQHVSTRKLKSGKTMTVTMTHGDGLVVNHSWTDKAYEVDPVDFVPAQVEMLSLRDFFAKTSKERAKYLLRRLGIKPVDIPEFVSRMKLILIEAGCQDTDGVVNPLEKFWKDLSKNDWIAWLDAISAKAAESLSYQRNRKAECEAAVAATATALMEPAISSVVVSDRSLDIAAVDAERTVATKALNDLTARLATVATEIRGLIADGTRINREIKALEAKKLLKPSCCLCGKEVQCDCAGKGFKEIDGGIAGYRSTLLQERDRYNAAVKLQSELQPEIDVAQVYLSGINAMAIELRASQSLWNIEQGKVSVQANHELDAAKYADLAAGYSLVVKFIAKEIQDKVDESIAPLLAIANKVIYPTIGTNLRYEEGDFYFQRKTLPVALEAWSGSESAVVLAGLQFALTADHPFRIIILDEMGRMTTVTINRFIKVIEGMIQDGSLHQFVGAIPGIAVPFADNISIIDMGQK